MQQKTAILSKYPNRNAFLDAVNPGKQVLCAQHPLECVNECHPTLSLLNDIYGKNTSQIWLLPQLFNLSEYAGVKEKFSSDMLEDLAAVIATEYRYLRTTELLLFFYRFKAGHYGRFYGTADPLVITTALRERFLPERVALIDKREQLRRDERESRRKVMTRAEYDALVQRDAEGSFG